ncbi:MAG: hypothetical protein J6Z11_17250 [Candidatus Riflebacteria bacterium]|nr:hypothetical protein [Candidatus Riflebacteria bacterium]
MQENEEIILKTHDLKLRIQAAIIQDHKALKETDDVGYTSWIIANHIVDGIIRDKEELKAKRIHRKKNFIDFFLPKL